jgi:alkylhydroperoxidase family enzyme
MENFISPPVKIPFFLRLPIWISRKMTGKDLLPAKMLAWYPRAAVGSGVLEVMAAHPEKKIDERILKLVRIQASLTASCAFCFDMNSFHAEEAGISGEELQALQGRTSIDGIATFSQRERLAIEYARLITSTPLIFPPGFSHVLLQYFNEREIVLLASTAAQVNYWARLIQALGIPPAGFTDQCKI